MQAIRLYAGYDVVYANYRLICTPFMMFDKKYKKYWNTFGVVVSLLVMVSMVLLYAAPSLFR